MAFCVLITLIKLFFAYLFVLLKINSLLRVLSLSNFREFLVISLVFVHKNLSLFLRLVKFQFVFLFDIFFFVIFTFVWTKMAVFSATCVWLGSWMKLKHKDVYCSLSLWHFSCDFLFIRTLFGLVKKHWTRTPVFAVNRSLSKQNR